MGRHLGIDFSRILVDFGSQVGQENRAKREPNAVKWSPVKSSQSRQGQSSQVKSCQVQACEVLSSQAKSKHVKSTQMMSSHRKLSRRSSQRSPGVARGRRRSLELSEGSRAVLGHSAALPEAPDYPGSREKSALVFKNAEMRVTLSSNTNSFGFAELHHPIQDKLSSPKYR